MNVENILILVHIAGQTSVPPTLSPATRYALLAKGLIEENGMLTPAGVERARVLTEEDDAKERNAERRRLRSVQEEEERAREWADITRLRQEAREASVRAIKAEDRIMVPGQPWNADAAREVGIHQLAAREAKAEAATLFREYCLKWGGRAPGAPKRK